VFQKRLITQVEGVLADPRVVASTLTGGEGVDVQLGMLPPSKREVVLELADSGRFW